MKVAFVSNYYNHHQAPCSEALFKLLNGKYTFISTEKMDDERAAMGWGNIFEPSFVIQYDEEPLLCDKIIDEYDIVIIGSAPYSLIKNRVKKGKITFLYTERLFKKKVDILRLLKYKFLYHRWFGRYKNFYLLCASAFTYADFLKVLSFKNKGYKWGYFPKTFLFDDLENKIEEKEQESVSLLFVSRLIPLKHPELPIFITKRLKDEGIKVKLTIIGNGTLKNDVLDLIAKNQLDEDVSIIESLKPEQVREHMIKSNILLFTSDRNEGWGAVMNEAMNSGCAIVASSAIGSVPFLLNSGENGFIYKDGDFEDLYKKTKLLCVDKQLRQTIGKNAYKNITEVWSAENAAKRFLVLCDDIMKFGESNGFKNGPCSKAKVVKDNWFDNK